jgi:hypothetical protein
MPYLFGFDYASKLPHWDGPGRALKNIENRAATARERLLGRVFQHPAGRQNNTHSTKTDKQAGQKTNRWESGVRRQESEERGHNHQPLTTSHGELCSPQASASITNRKYAFG